MTPPGPHAADARCNAADGRDAARGAAVSCAPRCIYFSFSSNLTEEGAMGDELLKRRSKVHMEHDAKAYSYYWGLTDRSSSYRSDRGIFSVFYPKSLVSDESKTFDEREFLHRPLKLQSLSFDEPGFLIYDSSKAPPPPLSHFHLTGFITDKQPFLECEQFLSGDRWRFTGEYPTPAPMRPAQKRELALLSEPRPPYYGESGLFFCASRFPLCAEALQALVDFLGRRHELPRAIHTRRVGEGRCARFRLFAFYATPSERDRAVVDVGTRVFFSRSDSYSALENFKKVPPALARLAFARCEAWGGAARRGRYRGGPCEASFLELAFATVLSTLSPASAFKNMARLCRARGGTEGAPAYAMPRPAPSLPSISRAAATAAPVPPPQQLQDPVKLPVFELTKLLPKLRAPLLFGPLPTPRHCNALASALLFLRAEYFLEHRTHGLPVPDAKAMEFLGNACRGDTTFQTELAANPFLAPSRSRELAQRLAQEAVPAFVCVAPDLQIPWYYGRFSSTDPAWLSARASAPPPPSQMAGFVLALDMLSASAAAIFASSVKFPHALPPHLAAFYRAALQIPMATVALDLKPAFPEPPGATGDAGVAPELLEARAVEEDLSFCDPLSEPYGSRGGPEDEACTFDVSRSEKLVVHLFEPRAQHWGWSPRPVVFGRAAGLEHKRAMRQRAERQRATLELRNKKRQAPAIGVGPTSVPDGAEAPRPAPAPLRVTPKKVAMRPPKAPTAMQALAGQRLALTQPRPPVGPTPFFRLLKPKIHASPLAAKKNKSPASPPDAQSDPPSAPSSEILSHKSDESGNSVQAISPIDLAAASRAARPARSTHSWRTRVIPPLSRTFAPCKPSLPFAPAALRNGDPALSPFYFPALPVTSGDADPPDLYNTAAVRAHIRAGIERPGIASEAARVRLALFDQFLESDNFLPQPCPTSARALFSWREHCARRKDRGVFHDMKAPFEQDTRRQHREFFRRLDFRDIMREGERDHAPASGQKSLAMAQTIPLRSTTHGFGLFAVAPIAPETRVVEYVGVEIGEKQADTREHAYLAAGNNSIYMFSISDDNIIDSTFHGNNGRFLNHSCDANCYADLVCNKGRIVIKTKRSIERGEELNFVYHFAKSHGAQQTLCNCGSKNCRGFIS